MKNLVEEIHRRSLWQVLGIYLAGSWIALQVVNEIAAADEAGDFENAAPYYAAFVELWSDADAELQPRVGVARDRLEEILEARG